MPSPYKEIFIGVLSSIFILLLAWGYIIGAIHLIKSWNSKKWPFVKGVITRSSVDEKTDSDGTSYETKISYKYSIHEKQFESDNVAFWGLMPLSKSVAMKHKMKFVEGNEVNVYYNPLKPEDAALCTGFQSEHLFTVFYVVFTSLLMFYVLMQRI